MNIYRNILLSCSIFFLVSPLASTAQTVDATPEISNICFGNTATLSATYAGPVVTATTNYSISNIPFAPDPMTLGTSVTLTDDSQTGLLPIGFNFCYFGNTYSQFIIGSNNWVGFSSGQTSTWVTAPIPVAGGITAPMNTIMGAWQDINPGVGGTVKYAVYGTAPFRRLSVSWNNVPMFSCTSQLYSSQIIIYETTNIIETHILNRSLCGTWNSGNAVHGLHNSTGTVAIVVPGRNNTPWTAVNEGTRFTPSGPATSTINWYILPSNTLVGTGPSITVTPPVGQASTLYYAQVTSTGTCVSGFGTDTVQVIQTNCAPCTTTASNSGSACIGSSIGLTSVTTTLSGVSTYAWTGPGGYTASTANPTISPITAGSSGTYTLTVTELNGSSCTDTTNVAVYPVPPTPTPSNNGPVCSGSTLNLTTPAVAGATYSWTGPNGFTSTAQNPSIASVTNLATGTYSVTITVNGCLSAVGTTNVSINNTPNPPIPQINGSIAPAPICAGGTLTLTANNIAGATYSWTGPNSYTAAVRNPPAITGATALMSGTYSLTVTVGGCTSLPGTVSIVVNAIPAAPTVPSDTVCSGQTATLTASAPGGTYDWFTVPTGGTAFFTGSSYTTPVLAATTTYYVQSTISGCVGPRTAVTVTVAPSFSVSTIADDSICAGTSITLGVASPVGTYTYSWDEASTTGFSTSASPSVSPTTTTTYTVTLTDALGCSGTDNITITVGTPLAIVASGTPANCSSTCDGQGTVAASGSFAPYTYSWSNGDATPSINSLCATNYTITVTDLIGCTVSDTIQVQGPTPITLSTTTTAAHCSLPDGSATVTATGGVGGYTYNWMPGAITSANATGLAPGTYTVTVTDANGCSLSTTAVVPNLPSVIATITSATAITCNAACNGTLTTTATSGTAPYTYLWSNGQTTATATALCAGSYTCTVTDSVGCTDTAHVTITQPTAIFVDALPPVTICNGQNATLTATAIGGTGSYTFSWNAPAFTGNPNVVSPTTSTTYSVSATDSQGCNSTNTQTVTVTVRPPLSIVASNDESICPGATASLSAVAAGGNSATYTYSWMPGGSTSSSINVSPSTTTNYTVTVSDGCTTLSASDNVLVTVLPVPTVNFSANITSGCSPVCVSFSDLSTIAAGSSITNWNWAFDGTTSAISNPNYCFNAQGTSSAYNVTLTATSNFGCTSTLMIPNMISVYAVPTAIFTYNPQPVSVNYPTVSFTDQSANATAWNWTFGDSLFSPTDNSSFDQNPDHTYSVDGEYCVKLTVSNTPSCVDDTTICLVVEPDFTLYIPNSFTPNGNGLNDEFYPKGENIAEFEMLIYNRWGNLVFRADDISKHWNGTWQGKGGEIVEQDVYVYIINLKDKVGQKRQFIGHVTVIK